MSTKRRKRFAAHELQQAKKHRFDLDSRRKEAEDGSLRGRSRFVKVELLGDVVRFDLELPAIDAGSTVWRDSITAPATLHDLLLPLVSALCNVALGDTSDTRINRVHALTVLIEYWTQVPPKTSRPSELSSAHGTAYVAWLIDAPSSNGAPRSRSTIRTLVAGLQKLIDNATSEGGVDYGLRVNTKRFAKENPAPPSPTTAIDAVVFYQLRNACAEIIRTFRVQRIFDSEGVPGYDPAYRPNPQRLSAFATSEPVDLATVFDVIKSRWPMFPLVQPKPTELRALLGEELYIQYLRRHREGNVTPLPEVKKVDPPKVSAGQIQAGDRIGSWTVVSRAPTEQRYMRRWMCRCDCGTERVLTAHVLAGGGSARCRKCSYAKKAYVRHAGLMSALISLCAPTRLVMVAYLVLIFIELGRLNAETFLRLKRSDIRWLGSSDLNPFHPENTGRVQFDTAAVVGPKPRSSEPQVAVVSQLREVDSHELGGYTLLREWFEMTEFLQGACEGELSGLLWLYVGHATNARARGPIAAALMGARKTDVGLSNNFEDGLRLLVDKYFPKSDGPKPSVSLRGIRNYVAQLVYRAAGGDVRAVQEYLNHRFRSTTENYLNQTLIRQESYSNLGDVLQRIAGHVQAGPDYHHRDEPRRIDSSDYSVESLLNAATPGYSCINPLDSPIEGQKEGVNCVAVGACYACKNKLLNVDSPMAFAHLREAREVLTGLSDASMYAASLLVHVEADLQRFRDDVVRAAEEFELIGRRLPISYFV